MKKLKSIIFIACLAISIVIFPAGENTAIAEGNEEIKDSDILIAMISSIKDQFKTTNGRTIKDVDELLSYANYLAKGDAIEIWDEVYDTDGIAGNTLSKNRYLADGSNILFQTKSEADKRTDTLMHYALNGDTLEAVTDRTIIFSMLDQMDKIKNDNILQDSFGHTIGSSVFMDTPGIKILLRKDKFLIFDTASMTLTKANPNIKKVNVLKVTIDKNAVSLSQGEQYQLTATISPINATEKSIKWSSDNSNIARIDETGNITGITIGKAKITATTMEGKKTAVCQVTVTENTKTAIAANKFNYKVGQTANLYCAAAYGTLSWVSTDKDTVIIVSTSGQNCTIRCLKKGTATIIASVQSSELLYDPVKKIFIKMPKVEDYVHYNIKVQ